MSNKWNFLIVDDDEEILEMLKETFETEGFLGDSVVSCVTAKSFNDALVLVENSSFDLLVLDLQDDAEDDASSENYGGERILASLKQHQFTPVVFHTGYAEKIRDLEGRFVKVVRKGAHEELSAAVKYSFDTKLPSLIRYIKEQQRKYLWDHVENGGISADDLSEDSEVAYLLARRLASSLSSSSIRKFFNPELDLGLEKIHPVEYYIYPPVSYGVGLGDIVVDSEQGGFYLVVNPACDFAQGKVENVLLVRCTPLKEIPELSSIRELIMQNSVVSKAKRNELKGILADNRKLAGLQPERYKYLPGTSFIPHLVADFQMLSQVQHGELEAFARYNRVATVDTPFAEAIQAKFARYYGRFGVPDIDSERLVAMLIAEIEAEQKGMAHTA
ncbi:response regulator [Pseudomonas putida]|uniref:response regulator n=1 Tax=Pseudomonas putida TaxID=303 RepID=UPI0002E3F2F8|nr:response regulator [Pseudomonas putida]